ncbi:hypothetical protein [Leptospira wolffii]|uniref:hypothetical protein n=1 Tax=Leptospira wolffii TaxID=409998 RepID=UPI000353EF22|nr:hypothetical protein [Leptospira wolffii]EPG64509.1 hypothetical protein LEP1GSC061_3748 [Leptospira wolffii serovar Khorat str. Khorat-H2]
MKSFQPESGCQPNSVYRIGLAIHAVCVIGTVIIQGLWIGKIYLHYGFFLGSFFYGSISRIFFSGLLLGEILLILQNLKSFYGSISEREIAMRRSYTFLMCITAISMAASFLDITAQIFLGGNMIR